MQRMQRAAREAESQEHPAKPRRVAQASEELYECVRQEAQGKDTPRFAWAHSCKCTDGVHKEKPDVEDVGDTWRSFDQACESEEERDSLIEENRESVSWSRSTELSDSEGKRGRKTSTEGGRGTSGECDCALVLRQIELGDEKDGAPARGHSSTLALLGKLVAPEVGTVSKESWRPGDMSRLPVERRMRVGLEQSPPGTCAGPSKTDGTATRPQHRCDAATSGANPRYGKDSTREYLEVAMDTSRYEGVDGRTGSGPRVTGKNRPPGHPAITMKISLNTFRKFWAFGTCKGTPALL
ncbi:hypothetical protein K438DRAFT_1773044 [Mycena galopus ATCC 62051]|nr:hypothetical protein K438DRAFT_1773044 [Mycena galopus ATCC 62051]